MWPVVSHRAGYGPVVEQSDLEWLDATHPKTSRLIAPQTQVDHYGQTHVGTQIHNHVLIDYLVGTVGTVRIKSAQNLMEEIAPSVVASSCAKIGFFLFLVVAVLVVAVPTKPRPPLSVCRQPV